MEFLGATSSESHTFVHASSTSSRSMNFDFSKVIDNSPSKLNTSLEQDFISPIVDENNEATSDVVVSCQSPKQKQFVRLTFKKSFKEASPAFCCYSSCLRKLGWQRIKQERENFLILRRANQNIVVRANIRSSTLPNKYIIFDSLVCRKCFMKVYNVSACPVPIGLQSFPLSQQLRPYSPLTFLLTHMILHNFGY